jgi:hypothetical protein
MVQAPLANQVAPGMTQIAQDGVGIFQHGQLLSGQKNKQANK